MYTQQEIIDKIVPILQNNYVKRSALFGSYARNEQTENSDVDLLIEINDTQLPDYVYVLWDCLEESLKLPIDIITFNAFNDMLPRAKNKISNEMRWLYEI